MTTKTTQSKHTPAPWVYENRNGDDPRNTNAGWGTIGLWGSDNSLILGSGPGWDGEFQEPTKEDARLIASAPELLEACKFALESGDDLKAIEKLKAAIARAEGREG